MDRTDDEVEPIENVRSVVEPAVGEDVGFDALENRDTGISGRVQLVDLLHLRLERFLGETSGVERGLRVIGDADVPPAARRGAARHVGDRRLAVRIERVAVEDAANVVIGDERRERTARGGVDFAEPFTQRRIHEVETGKRVHGFFIGCRNRRAISLESRGAEREPSLHEARRDRGDVLGAPRRGDERKPEIAVERAVQAERDSVDEQDLDRRAGPGRLFHSANARERRGDGLGIGAAPGDDVEVADRLAMAAQGSGDGHAHDVGMRRDHRPQSLALGASVVVESLRPARPEERDAGENLVGGLLAVARELGETPVAGGLLELVDGLDGERLVNPEDLRRSHARHPQHLKQSLGSGGPELLEIQGLAMLDEIAHDRERRRTESANRGELAGLQRVAYIIGPEPAQRPGGGIVGARLEAILPVELEVRRDLREDVRRGPRIDRQG